MTHDSSLSQRSTVDAPDVQAPDMRIVDINLVGEMHTTRLALNNFLLHPEVSPHDKCLILKSSLAGYLDAKPSYSSAKFGLRAVMRSLRHMGTCRVNIVAPW
jgi:NAD(P)-dependent dehydrogenase (short-subunit alcohol dehydrogenase family)